MTEDFIDDAVILLASITGWQPDTIESMSASRFAGYLLAAQRKKLIGRPSDD